MNEYFINYDKSRDACSITWESVNYDINELEPYIYAIQCDDGAIFYELVSSECPESNGKDHFQTIELNNFEAVKGDKQLLIPINDEIITKVDRENKTIFITTPEGLVDLYLS